MKRLAMILALLPLAAAAQPTARQCRQINRDSIEVMTICSPVPTTIISRFPKPPSSKPTN
ncbi:hypothetical protein [Eikenella corrodens]|uniref:hypothetical protein n=1 Tax=Eikenella corrodens TaxID=539 RepID=UPI00129AD4F8|nr:hypothetical protein [Eikenella corrodens]